MGNDDFNQNKELNLQNQSNPSTTSLSPNSNSENIQELKKYLQSLQVRLHESDALALEKTQALEVAQNELTEKTEVIRVIKTDLEAQTRKVTYLEAEMKRLKTEFQEQLNEKMEQIISIEVELKDTKDLLSTIEGRNQELEAKEKETKKIVEGLQKTVEDAHTEKKAFLTQIAKLQDVIHQTEEEIKEIETNHLEIEEQLRLEIKRTEERAGQMSADLERETTGVLARDRHIRVVLQQTELGRILLFIVDYFENTKKRSLALETLSDEVGVPLIICRTHLRHLHELAVCDFNELTREIKLIKRAK
ncbi:MAG: hypothetical protein JSV04_14295 [Candidatus Heimdallarchaeota archaeon]|nr:MAG: hypothetical protein JSV04_14295 [Candidatus Heimdallarchaeota archaeon]